MRIAIITAGGAGMFCGSCMHDNTLARALIAAGHTVWLVPTYTPIRVDEQNVSESQVFLGGINVYLDAKAPLWRKLPRVLTRWLDAPAILRFATRWGVNSDAKQLGTLTIALLKGDLGPQAKEIAELVDHLASELRPDVVLYSNALLSGTLRALKRRFAGRVFCLLQGDDIFLEDLPEPHRSQALEIIRRECREFDGLLVHSEYYRRFMSSYLRLPLESLRVTPLGIDLQGHDGQPRPSGQPFTIGYFARICPEKGLHNLLAAFRLVREQLPEARLKAGGFLGSRDQAYFQRLQNESRDLGAAFEYIGSPATHQDKVAFLKSLDVLSVPTDYQEPKGLSILESLANGVPVVQPAHGSFPELLAATGGGLLCEPKNPRSLADALLRLGKDPQLRFELATAGRAAVRARFDAAAMAKTTVAALNSRPNGPQ